MQLSKLTGAIIEFKVFLQEDNSFVEYYSHGEDYAFQHINPKSPVVDEHARFSNKHYDFVTQIDEKSGFASVNSTDSSDSLLFDKIYKKSQEIDLQCKNIISLLSLAKKP